MWQYADTYQVVDGLPLIPGCWYYSDETEQANGPFSSFRQAAWALRDYVEHVLNGRP